MHVNFVISCRTMCDGYQQQTEASDPVFFITEVLLLPFFLVVGLVGCPLLLVILTRRSMPTEDSPIYVYASGLASSDLLLFCSSIPRFIRAVDTLPLTVAFSRPMAYALLVGQGLGPACRHTAIWLTALTVAARTFGVRFRGVTPPNPTPATTPLTLSKWNSVRVGRVLVLLVFLSCVLLNFTRFLDSEVVELTTRCQEPTSMWTRNATRLGLDATYRRVRPVVVCFLGHVIPLTVALVFVLTLACASNCCRHRRKFLLRTPKNRAEREFLVNAFVLSISISLLVLETPSAFLAIFEACFQEFFDHSSIRHFHLVSRCLGLLRPVLGIVFTVLINHSFRKTCKHTFCCCCRQRKRDIISNRVISCCHGYRKPDDDVTAKTNDVRLGDRNGTKIVVATKNRRPIMDNVYDEVNSFKPNLRSKAVADMGIWI